MHFVLPCFLHDPGSSAAYLEDPGSGAECIAFFSQRRLTGERQREKDGGEGEGGVETALANPNPLHVAECHSQFEKTVTRQA